MKSFLIEQQLALLELCQEPQPFESIKAFLKMNNESARKEINKLRYRGLIKEVKGPTYNFWETTVRGKEVLNE